MDWQSRQGIVWIIGASSGIGRALAQRFCEEGFNVCASARSKKELKDLAEHCRDLPGAVHPFPLDITDKKAVAKTIDTIELELGPITLAVLAAGVYHPALAKEMKIADWQQTFDVNVQGVVNVLLPLCEVMRQHNGGQICVIASVAGYRGLPTAAAYGASKAALINMCEALHSDLKKDNIFLQVVNPGFVKTPMTEKNKFTMPFLMDVDEAAKALYKGFHSKKFEVTFPWQFVTIMKLLRCLPYFAYFWVNRQILKRSKE